MKNFEYIYPKNVESIPAILGDLAGNSLLFAGGTDAIVRLKEGIVKPSQIINLKAVDELAEIQETDDGLHIGATVILNELLKSEEAAKIKGLIEATQSISTVQLRNMGTVGGNLCQRPRCWYFRSRHFPCVRKGGDTCFAVDGENKYHCILGGDSCYIIHPSDLAPMLIALDAKISILGPAGKRQLNLEDFYVLPAQDVQHETVLKSQELLTEVLVPKSNCSSHYLKFKERGSFDFALVSVALAADVTGNKLNNLRIVMGGVAPAPWRAKQAEQVLEGKEVNDAIIEMAADAELKDAESLEHNEYKILLCKNLLKKAIRELMVS
jgi:xanthine dehydrogenase YagS FAD-binding subunit